MVAASHSKGVINEVLEVELLLSNSYDIAPYWDLLVQYMDR